MVGAAAYMVKVRIKLSQLPSKLKLKLKLSLAKEWKNEWHTLGLFDIRLSRIPYNCPNINQNVGKIWANIFLIIPNYFDQFPPKFCLFLVISGHFWAFLSIFGIHKFSSWVGETHISKVKSFIIAKKVKSAQKWPKRAKNAQKYGKNVCECQKISQR